MPATRDGASCPTDSTFRYVSTTKKSSRLQAAVWVDDQATGSLQGGAGWGGGAG